MMRIYRDDALELANEVIRSAYRPLASDAGWGDNIWRRFERLLADAERRSLVLQAREAMLDLVPEEIAAEFLQAERASLDRKGEVKREAERLLSESRPSRSSAVSGKRMATEVHLGLWGRRFARLVDGAIRKDGADVDLLLDVRAAGLAVQKREFPSLADHFQGGCIQEEALLAGSSRPMMRFGEAKDVKAPAAPGGGGPAQRADRGPEL